MVYSSVWNNKVFSPVWKKGGGPAPVPVGPLYIIPGQDPFGSPSGIYSYSTDFSSWTNAVLPGYSTSNMEDCHTDGKAVYSIISPPDVDQLLGYTKDGTNWTFDDSKIFGWVASSGGLCMVEAQDSDLAPNIIYKINDGVLTQPTLSAETLFDIASNDTKHYLFGLDGGNAVFSVSSDGGDTWTDAANAPYSDNNWGIAANNTCVLAAGIDTSTSLPFVQYTKDDGATGWVTGTPSNISSITMALADACYYNNRVFVLYIQDDFSASYLRRTTSPDVGWDNGTIPGGGALVGLKITSLLGKLVMTLFDPADGFTSYYATSTDNGSTWTTPVKLFDNVPALRPSGFEQYFA